MNIQKLYTRCGAVYVDVAQWFGYRDLFTIYTAGGELLSVVGDTLEIRKYAGYGVHRSNLFASLELALDFDAKVSADAAAYALLALLARSTPGQGVLITEAAPAQEVPKSSIEIGRGMKQMYKPVCAICTSDLVSADAYVTWDAEHQDWKIEAVYEKTSICAGCGSIRLDWVEMQPNLF